MINILNSWSSPMMSVWNCYLSVQGQIVPPPSPKLFWEEPIRNFRLFVDGKLLQATIPTIQVMQLPRRKYKVVSKPHRFNRRKVKLLGRSTLFFYSPLHDYTNLG